MKRLIERGNAYRFLEDDEGRMFLTILLGGIASELVSIPLDDVEAGFIRDNPDRAEDFVRQVALNEDAYRPRAIQPVIWD